MIETKSAPTAFSVDKKKVIKDLKKNLVLTILLKPLNINCSVLRQGG